MMYKKIEIKSVEDLPKESGYYLMGKGSNILDAERVHFHGIHGSKKFYYETYDFYLLPISEDEYLREELNGFKYFFNNDPYAFISDEHIRLYLKTRKV